MSAYSNLVIADGASNFWRLNEPSGTTAVDIVGGKNGTISGGVTLNQPGALSDGDPAMAFNGTTGMIRAAAVTIPLVATIEFWFKRVVTPDTVLLSSRGTGSAGNVVYVGFSGAALMLFSTVVSNGAKVFSNADTQWFHVAIVLTGTTAMFYVNGVQDGVTSAQVRTTPSTGPFDVARDDPNNNNFGGSLDDVAIYPVALTPAQIAAHYQARLLSGSRRPLPAFVLAHRRFPS